MALRLSTGRIEPDDPDEFKAELTEHLAELRSRIIRSCGYVAIGMVVMYVLFRPIYGLLAAPIIGKIAMDPLAHVPGAVGATRMFVFSNFAEPFLLRMQISVIGGLILAVPFVILELWGFISPGLTKKERQGVRLVAPFTVFLFLVGVGVAFIAMPMAIQWFLSFLDEVPGAVLFQNPLTYIVFTVKMMLAFGLVFQLPVVLLFLGKVGIITSSLMIRYWRHITVGLFTAAMVAAPSNDPGTMLLLAIPLTALFLISIWLVKLVEPKPPKA